MNITPFPALHPVSPEDLIAYLDRDLNESEAHEVESHLSECADCFALVESFRELSRNLLSWKIEAVPEAVSNRIEQALAATTGTVAIPRIHSYTTALRSKSRRATFPWNYKLAGGLAAVLVVMLFGFAQYRSRTQGQAARLQSFMKPEVQAHRESVAEPQATSADMFYDAGAPPPAPASKSEAYAYSIAPLNATRGRIGGGGDNRAERFLLGAPMIARNVSLTVEVKDFAATRNALDRIVARYSGYPAQLTVNTPDGSARTIQASLRIPAPQLVAAVADLKSLGHVVNETQSGEEVTQQHADLVARLKNSHETEERLQTILQQRTGKIEDVLQVEEEIARVRGEIEGMESEQKAVEHRVDFASIELQLTEEYKAQLNVPDDSVANRMNNAFVSGYRNASDSVVGLVLIAAKVGPTLLVLLAIFGVPALLLWRKFRRMLEKTRSI